MDFSHNPINANNNLKILEHLRQLGCGAVLVVDLGITLVDDWVVGKGIIKPVENLAK